MRQRHFRARQRRLTAVLRLANQVVTCLKSRMESMQKPAYYTVPAVSRAAAILKHLLNDRERALRLSEVSEMLGVSKSVAHGLLNTLKDEGLLDQWSDGSFGLSALLRQTRATRATDYFANAQRILSQMRDQCGETCQSAILVEKQALSILVVESPHELRLGVRVGQLRPLYCSGVGKALLAWMSPEEQHEYVATTPLHRYTESTIVDPDMLLSHLSHIRSQGYAIDDEEHQVGGRCIAAPVFGNDQIMIAAISISAPAARFTRSLIPRYAELVTRAAQELSALKLDPPTPFSTRL